MGIGELIPNVVRHNYKLLTNPLYRELTRLKNLPRYTPTKTSLIGLPMYIADAASTLAGYEEIFVNKHYQFVAKSPSPLIIDCGANIGLSISFFKRLYPDSKIIGFEPDPNLFGLLQKNIALWGYENVEIHQKAIWKEETIISFKQEGGFSGRISQSDVLDRVDVKTVCLSTLLNQKVDFLKIDIEGAETQVIAECSSQLKNVDYLFIEYHSFEHECQTLDSILKAVTNAGFNYHIKQAYAANTPFIERPTIMGMDFQLDIFAFRK
jgi:FkbM family methyltransferase